MKACLILALSLFFSLEMYGTSQVEDLTVPQDSRALVRAGKLLTVTLVPQDKNFQIHLAGKKAAVIDFSKSEVQVFISVNGGPQKSVSMKRDGNYFTSAMPIENNGNYDVEVKAKAAGKSENFKFEIKNKLP